MSAALPGHPGRRRPKRHALAAAVALTAAVAVTEPVWTAGQIHRIAMKDVAFAPAQIAVHVGDTVAWNNAGIVAHSATSEEGGFDVDVLPGGEQRATMTRPGSFGYICRYHPNMEGRIAVKP